jgi:hypothetical protein
MSLQRTAWALLHFSPRNSGIVSFGRPGSSSLGSSSRGTLPTNILSRLPHSRNLPDLRRSLRRRTSCKASAREFTNPSKVFDALLAGSNSELSRQAIPSNSSSSLGPSGCSTGRSEGAFCHRAAANIRRCRGAQGVEVLRSKCKIGQVGVANSAYLRCLHRYAWRNALGRYWPTAKPAVAHRCALVRIVTPCN